MYPILKYPGAKWRIANWVISHMPEHESYVEPYFGSGAILFSKLPARIETINDLDGEVVNFFRVCREFPSELAYVVEMTPWARDEFDTACQIAPGDSIERARCFAVRCWMAFGASTDSTSWRHSTGRKENGGPDNPKLWNRVPNTIYEVARRLKDVQIENRPALDIIRRFDGPNVLVYADPPYLQDTRTAHRDQYNHEMSDADHVELLEALNRHSGMVLLSGYDCELYQDMLFDWQVVRTSAQAERGAARIECLWLNPAVCDVANEQQRLKGFEI